ncbi:carbohydrate ABC transporter permease [Microbacterium sp. G2-8]|uniref:carbohydrate ABC transporter permease n=1 Tax=Microbacterium sp. G2-8 TaxID=2842454 RepID=UPI001C8AD04C|nr:carbohydrate ABC transporter permease [Microbacterium sp. G2-8]
MISRILRYGILAVIGILWLLPIYLLLANASKLTSEYSGLTLWSPGNLPALLSNIVAVFTTTDVPTGLLTTFLYALVAPIVAVVLGAGVGYAVIALKLRNGFFWFFVVFCGTIFPLQMLIIPLFAAYTQIGMFDTFVGMAIVYSVVSVPFSAFVMRNFFSGIAETVFEAAVVDGAGPFRIFTRIYLPMSRSALVVVFILQATWVWNDFLLALVLTQSAETRPVMPLLQALQAGAEGGGAPFTIMLTAGLLVSIPTGLLFMFAQRFFQKGLALGQY